MSDPNKNTEGALVAKQYITPAQTIPRSKGWRESRGSIKQSQVLINLEEVRGRFNRSSMSIDAGCLGLLSETPCGNSWRCLSAPLPNSSNFPGAWVF